MFKPFSHLNEMQVPLLPYAWHHFHHLYQHEGTDIKHSDYREAEPEPQATAHLHQQRGSIIRQHNSSYFNSVHEVEDQLVVSYIAKGTRGCQPGLKGHAGAGGKTSIWSILNVSESFDGYVQKPVQNMIMFGQSRDGLRTGINIGHPGDHTAQAWQDFVSYFSIYAVRVGLVATIRIISAGSIICLQTFFGDLDFETLPGGCCAWIYTDFISRQEGVW